MEKKLNHVPNKSLWYFSSHTFCFSNPEGCVKSWNPLPILQEKEPTKKMIFLFIKFQHGWRHFFIFISMFVALIKIFLSLQINKYIGGCHKSVYPSYFGFFWINYQIPCINIHIHMWTKNKKNILWKFMI